MGQVVFYGDSNSQDASTTCFIACAALIGLEYSVRTLLAHTSKAGSLLEMAFGERSSGNLDPVARFSDTGVDALERLARSQRLTPERVQDYSTPILRDRLDLLRGTMKQEVTHAAADPALLPAMMNCASRYYGLTLLDWSGNGRGIGGSADSTAAEAVLHGADLVVVRLPQHTEALERYFAKRDWPEALHAKPRLVVLGPYDRHSKYSMVNIARRYKHKEPIYSIPYNTDFIDAINDRSVVDFFMRNRNATKRSDNYFFMEEIRRLSAAIMSNMGYSLKKGATS